MRIFAIGTILALLLCSNNALAAHVIRAPIQDLLAPNNVIAVMRLSGFESHQTRGRFVTVQNLWGTAQDTVSIALGDPKNAKLTPGTRYIVAYSMLRKHPYYRDITEPDPGGAHLVEVNVAGRALFADSNRLRFLIQSLQAPNPEPQPVLAALLDVISASDASTRLLAVFEFYMRQEMYAKGFTPELAKRYRALVEPKTLPAQEQEFLIRAWRFFPSRFRGKWITQTCRDSIQGNGIRYDLGSFIPLLMKTCAGLLGRNGAPTDLSLLSGLLKSNSPGVAKSALDALITLDPAAAESIATRALESGGAASETQRAIRAYLHTISKSANH